MTLAHLPIMTPSSESTFVQPNPERSLPGHRWHPYSSTLPGLLCNIDSTNSSFHQESTLPISEQFCEKRDLYTSCRSDIESSTVAAYPSPPPTSSNPKRSVPLPSIAFHSGCGSTSFVFGSVNTKPVMGPGGTLDPPTVMSHEPQTPISPPPTIPTTTHALPTDSDAFPLQLPPTPEEDDADIFEDTHLESDESIESPSASPTFLEPPEASNSTHLLSPLSPEWTPSGICDFSLPQDTNYSLLSKDEHHSPLRRTVQPNEDSPTRPFLSSLNIPEGHRSPSPLGSIIGDEEHGMEVDTESSPEDPETLFTPSTPESEPPFLGHHDFFSKLDFDNFLGDDDEDQIPFPHPSSPSISTHELPELGFEDDDIHPSPPLSLISLPGAETDDELFPAELALASHHPDSPASTSSLLLIDDALPTRRSPSPETSDLDSDLATFLESSVAGMDNPDLQRLHAVRMRALAAERAARQKESMALEQGSVYLRAEARREKKKEKERAREVAALLRLKLGLVGKVKNVVNASDSPAVGDGDVEMEERVGVDGIVTKKKKKSKVKNIAGNMAGLVARMMFRRRNETLKPLSSRPPGLGQKTSYMRSSLSLSLAGASQDQDDNAEEDGLHTEEAAMHEQIDGDTDMESESTVSGSLDETVVHSMEGKVS